MMNCARKGMRTMADLNVIEKRTDGMDHEVKTNKQSYGVYRIALLALFTLMLFAAPQSADAQPNKKDTTKCSQCHNGALDPGMTTHASVDGVEGTSFSVAPGATMPNSMIISLL